MRKTTVAMLTAVGLVSMFATGAKAQTVAGALQLGVGTGLVNYSSPKYTAHEPAGAGTVDYEIDRPVTTWGFASRNGVMLEGGYGLNDMLVLGGIIQLGGWSFTEERPVATAAGARDKDSVSTFDLFIAPKLDVMFLPESRVRPFVGGAIGLKHLSYVQEHTGANSVTTTQYDLGLTGIGLLARAGIRWFLTPGFSIDPAFVFGFDAMSGSTSVPAGAGMASYDTGANGYMLGLNIAASGWVGL